MKHGTVTIVKTLFPHRAGRGFFYKFKAVQPSLRHSSGAGGFFFFGGLMKMKLPYLKFYHRDYLVDTRTLNLEERGAWMDLICHLWDKTEDGRLTITINELMSLWAVTQEKVEDIAFALEEKGIKIQCLSRDAGVYQVFSRRIMSDKKALKSNSFRQKAHRDSVTRMSHESNSEVTPNRLDVRSQIKTKTYEHRSPQGFAEFWSLYPKKKGKGAAEKAWDKLRPDAALQSKMLEAVGIQCAAPDWLRDGGQFIPHPATWLNQRRWEDEIETSKQEVIR